MRRRRRRRYSGRAAAREWIMEMRYECAFPQRERFLLLLLLFFIVGRHSPSLIKSRMTPQRHLVLIRATNAAAESSRYRRVFGCPAAVSARHPEMAADELGERVRTGSRLIFRRHQCR